MVVAMLLYSAVGYRLIFIVTIVVGVVSLLLIVMFQPSRVKALDDQYRKEAGKPLDDALAGRK